MTDIRKSRIVANPPISDHSDQYFMILWISSYENSCIAMLRQPARPRYYAKLYSIEGSEGELLFSIISNYCEHFTCNFLMQNDSNIITFEKLLLN